MCSDHSEYARDNVYAQIEERPKLSSVKKQGPAGQRWVLEQSSDFSLLVYHIFIIFIILHQFPSFWYIRKKVVTDRPTDQPTYRPTDGHTLI